MTSLDLKKYSQDDEQINSQIQIVQKKIAGLQNQYCLDNEDDLKINQQNYVELNQQVQ